MSPAYSSSVPFNPGNIDMAAFAARIDDEPPLRCRDMTFSLIQLYKVHTGEHQQEQIDLFDRLLLILAPRLEKESRIELATRIVDVSSIPPNLVHYLAQDDDIAVSGIVLTRVATLDDDFLMTCAQNRPQPHLLALAQRMSIPEPLADVIVKRGEEQVLVMISSNTGARFSNLAFSLLIQKAADIKALVSPLANRFDLPDHHFVRLITCVPPDERDALIARHRKGSTPPASVTVARDIDSLPVLPVQVADHEGPVDDHRPRYREKPENSAEIVARAVVEGDANHVAEVLAQLCKLPVQLVLEPVHEGKVEPLLILFKALGLSWTGAKSALSALYAPSGVPQSLLDHAVSRYDKLKPHMAAHVLALKQHHLTQS